MPGAILFDLDGTVWDSMPGILASLAHALAEVGIDPPPDADLVAHIGPPLTVMLADVGVPDDLVDLARDIYRDRYHRVGVYECAPYPGMVDALDQLRSDGWHLATATSKGDVATRLMLDHFDLTRCFDVIAAASMDASSHSKRDVVRRAIHGLSTLSAAPRQMVGDRRYDIEAGRDEGLGTVGVTWGYAPDGELETAGADVIVATPAALAAALLVGGP